MKKIIISSALISLSLISNSQVNLKSIDTNYIDKSFSPKEDFFMFANNNWIKNNPIPASESRWGSFNELEESNNIKLTDILTEAEKNTGEKGSQNQLLGDYYSSFIDIETRNKLGFTPIHNDLDKINEITNKKELISVISQMHKDGINALFSYSIDQDLKNVNQHISYFYQSGIGLPNCEYYTKPEKKDILEAYKVHINKLFQLIGYNELEAKNKANDIVVFETKLAESMMTKAELRVPENSYNPESKKNFLLKASNFDFETYFSLIGAQNFDTLIIGQPLYFDKINILFKNENLQTFKDYLIARTIDHYASHLSEDFISQNFSFYGTVLSGTKEMKPISERAINEITSSTIGDLLGKAFVEIYFSEKAQQKVNEMVDNLLVVFKKRIENLDWMTETTKKEALVKLNSIGRKLGFPEKWEDLSSLDFSKENYIGNIKAMAHYEHKKNMNELNKPVDKDKWGMPAHMVNAYYHPLLNEIAFPAGIMQPPFFDEDAEDAVNYGGIGMVIGHEFTHGFDDAGSKFDAEGTFRNWWSEEDLKRFEAKTATLGETFSNFCPIDGHCVNPDLTMGENIADLGGVTMAYYAYTMTEEFKSNDWVNGFSPAQRFFIAYAQLWKINYTKEEMKNRIANDPHSPGMYRVNGPLMNCPEFFKAFDIHEGDQMRNPSKKVAKIW
ncbi:MAG: M13 family metallopeptidase [Crocinitomicaceae bacterium]